MPIDWLKVAEWQGKAPLSRSVTVQGPGNRRTLIWESMAGNGIAVIRKVGDEDHGEFVDFEIRQKPFSTVVGQIKRARTLARKKGESEVALC